MESCRWKEFATAIRALAENSHKNSKEKAEAMHQVHQSSCAVRSVHDGKSSNLKFIAKVAVRKPNLIAHYKTLEEKLLSEAEYEEPNDFTPVNVRLRYISFMKSLCCLKLKCRHTTMGIILALCGMPGAFHQIQRSTTPTKASN